MESDEYYSEEFESEEDFEEESPQQSDRDDHPATPPDLLLDETRLFSRLLTSLEGSLLNSSKVNYSDRPESKRIALGVFLARLSPSREDFARRIHLEYSRKKEEMRTRLQQKLNNCRMQPRETATRFNDHLKALAAAGSMESDLFNYKEEQMIAQTTEELKKYVLQSIVDLEKQVRVSRHYIKQGQVSNLKRAEELQDEFLWRRFVQRVHNLARNKVIVSEPSTSIKSDVKRVLEDKLDCKIVLKNALLLEDHEFAEVSGGRQSTSDRKTAISKMCTRHIDTETRHMDKVLTKFLTLQHTPKASESQGRSPEKSRKQSVQSFPLHTCLSRSCRHYAVIASLQPIKWSPLTLLIYYPQKDISRLFDQTRPILIAEESVQATSGAVEVSNLAVSGTGMKGEVAGSVIELQVATVKTLALIANTVALPQLAETVELQYGSQPPTAANGLYVLETQSIFQPQQQDSRFLRKVTPAELEELCRFYLLRIHVQHIPRDLFPDANCEGGASLKYSYVLIRDLIVLRSGNFCRNWLLQFRLMPARPASVGPTPGPRFCRWIGCLAPSLEEQELAAMQQNLEAQFRNSISSADIKRSKKKRKSHSNDPSFTKKALAPIRKSKNSALDTSTSGSFCDFHCRLRHFMKANSMLLSPYLEDSANEVWKAVQAGMRWQAELSTKVRLGPVCNGNAKQALAGYFQHSMHCLSVSGRERRFAGRAKDQRPEDVFEQHREQLTETLSDLRAKRDTEVMFTNDLRELLVSSPSPGALQALSSLLTEAASSTVTVKLAKLRAIKDRLRDLAGNSTYSDLTDFKGYAPSSRPQSQNQNAHSERGKDASPEHQRTRLDDVLHRKIYTSPYGERLYKPGRAVKPKLPPKVPVKPQDSQQSSRKKIAMLNMD